MIRLGDLKINYRQDGSLTCRPDGNIFARSKITVLQHGVLNKRMDVSECRSGTGIKMVRDLLVHQSHDGLSTIIDRCHDQVLEAPHGM